MPRRFLPRWQVEVRRFLAGHSSGSLNGLVRVHPADGIAGGDAHRDSPIRQCPLLVGQFDDADARRWIVGHAAKIRTDGSLAESVVGQIGRTWLPLPRKAGGRSG
jgi:hypothetical protein